MALKIGKSLAPGLASIAGFGGGARGRAMGGRIHGFARGGFVPGTGNRDTVPAMLPVSYTHLTLPTILRV